MSYKKIVSLFAVSTLALGACGADNEDQPEEDNTEEKASSKDHIEQAKESSGSAFPEYGLEVVSGEWTVDGYATPFVEGEDATVSVAISSQHEEFDVYLVENDKIIDVESNEPEIDFNVDSPAEDGDYLVGVSGDDLGEVGDDVTEDDFYRSEKILFVETDEEEAEDE